MDLIEKNRKKNYINEIRITFDYFNNCLHHFLKIIFFLGLKWKNSEKKLNIEW